MQYDTCPLLLWKCKCLQSVFPVSVIPPKPVFTIDCLICWLVHFKYNRFRKKLYSLFLNLVLFQNFPLSCSGSKFESTLESSFLSAAKSSLSESCTVSSYQYFLNSVLSHHLYCSHLNLSVPLFSWITVSPDSSPFYFCPLSSFSLEEPDKSLEYGKLITKSFP